MPTTCIPASLNGFNSSMVRLGDGNFYAIIQRDSLFQFQYGSIGRIIQRRFLHGVTTVSIPVWFDWEFAPEIAPPTP